MCRTRIKIFDSFNLPYNDDYSTDSIDKVVNDFIADPRNKVIGVNSVITNAYGNGVYPRIIVTITYELGD